MRSRWSGTLYSKEAEALPPGAEPVRGRPDGKVYSRGAYQNAWKKEDGQWRIQRSAWTPDQ
jgi:hypothetical protein